MEEMSREEDRRPPGDPVLNAAFYIGLVCSVALFFLQGEAWLWALSAALVFTGAGFLFQLDRWLWVPCYPEAETGDEGDEGV
jgi:hypothetical protein